MNDLTIKQLLVVLVVSIVLCISIWSFAFWYTGVKFDYRADETSGFLALRLAPDAGLSYQWSDTGQSIWYWTAARNIRVWPKPDEPQ